MNNNRGAGGYKMKSLGRHKVSWRETLQVEGVCESSYQAVLFRTRPDWAGVYRVAGEAEKKTVKPNIIWKGLLRVDF